MCVRSCDGADTCTCAVRVSISVVVADRGRTTDFFLVGECFMAANTKVIIPKKLRPNSVKKMKISARTRIFSVLMGIPLHMYYLKYPFHLFLLYAFRNKLYLNVRIRFVNIRLARNLCIEMFLNTFVTPFIQNYRIFFLKIRFCIKLLTELL